MHEPNQSNILDMIKKYWFVIAILFGLFIFMEQVICL